MASKVDVHDVVVNQCTPHRRHVQIRVSSRDGPQIEPPSEGGVGNDGVAVWHGMEA